MKKIYYILLLIISVFGIHNSVYWSIWSLQYDYINSNKLNSDIQVKASKINKDRSYWTINNVWESNFKYQFWIGWFFNQNLNNNILKLKFDENFTGSLQISEIKNTLYNDFNDIKTTSIDLNWNKEFNIKLDLNFYSSKYSFLLSDNSKNHTDITNFKLTSWDDLVYNIWNDTIFPNHYTFTNNLTSISELKNEKIIFESDILKEEYQTALKLILNNRVTIKKGTNSDFIQFIFWSNNEKYIKKFTKEITVNKNYNGEYEVLKKWSKYYYYNKTFEYYKKWPIILSVYKKSDLYSHDNWRFSLNFDNEISFDTDINFSWIHWNYGNDIINDDVFITTDMRSKFITWDILYLIIIIYLFLILSFYFLYHNRLKSRYSILYFSFWIGLLFFTIYVVLFKCLVWSKDIIHNIETNFYYQNFTIKNYVTSNFSLNKNSLNLEYPNSDKLIQVNSYNNQRNRHSTNEGNRYNLIPTTYIQMNTLPLVHSFINVTYLDLNTPKVNIKQNKIEKLSDNKSILELYDSPIQDILLNYTKYNTWDIYLSKWWINKYFLSENESAKNYTIDIYYK